MTGGGRGVGRAITLRLARELPVVVVGRTLADLESVRVEAESAGGVVVPHAGDISDPKSSEAVVELARSRGWMIQHLVCNAGIGKSGPTADFDLGLWRTIFDINVHGCFQFVRACLPDLLSSGAGAITIMSSLAGVQGVAYDAAYSASKHALVGFARSLALEHRKRGLVVAALCPSFIESDMTRRTIRSVMRRRGITEADAEQRVAEHCPAKRILSAAEVAEVVALIGAHQMEAAVTLARDGGYPVTGTTELAGDIEGS